MNLVDKLSRQYRVQSESARTFRVTLPTKFSKKTGIKKGDELGITVNIDQSYGVVDFHQNPTEDMVTREVAGSNHLVRIPSAIGCSMQIRREMCNWELHINEEEEFVYRIRTPYIPLNISENSWNHIKYTDIEPTVSQEKEYFGLYIDNDMLDSLDWTEDTEIGFLVAQKDGHVGLRCQPNTDNNKEMFTTSVNRIDKNKTQLRTYIPRSLVRSCDMSNKEVQLYEKNNAIAIFSDI